MKIQYKIILTPVLLLCFAFIQSFNSSKNSPVEVYKRDTSISDGNLVTDTLKKFFTQIDAGVLYSVGLKNDSTVWTWGGSRGVSIMPEQISGLTGIIAVSAGYTHSLALKNDGTVWAWGKNHHGQLGIGTLKIKKSAFAVQCGISQEEE